MFSLRVFWGIKLDDVDLSAVAKSLNKLPKQVLSKLKQWILDVRNDGLRETRKRSGWHDEPLKGKRFGQRSVRLNRAYRAIYKEERNGTITVAVVEEVNKHDY
jgi:proteic killer suppression protein